MSLLPVSIIVSALNEGPWLKETLCSVTATPDAPQEIIVVDDGSVDGCCDELENLPLEHPVEIRVLRGARRGVAGARNAGAAIATQPVLTFLDAHCLAHPGWLQGLARAIEADPLAIVGPSVGDLDEPRYIGCGARLVGRGLKYQWNPAHGNSPVEVGIVPGGCLAISREFFANLGGFEDMRLYGFEDVEFSLRAWRFGARLLGEPASRIDHQFRRRHPFEVSPGDYIHNAVRTAMLHLPREMLRETLTLLSRHPDFLGEFIDLVTGDVFQKKAELDRRSRRDIQEYFSRFG